MKTSLLFALLLFVAGPSSAAPTVSLSPSSAGITPGTQLDVRVTANAEVPALGCFAFSVTYDPAVLSLTSASEGVVFASSLDPTFFGTGVDGLGRTQISGCVLGFQTSVTMPGEIATLHFDVIATGSTSIDLVDGILRDVDRAEIPGVVYQSSSVVVGATGTGPIGTGAASLTVSPNPSASIVQLALQGRAPTGGFDRLEIYDAAGRRVREIPWGIEVTQSQWDGRDAQGRTVAAGLYFAVLRGGDMTPLSTKILRLR